MMRLFQAIQNGAVETVSSLLKRGANPNARNEDKKTPLMVAVNELYFKSSEDTLNILKELLAQSANPNLKYKDTTALDMAIEICSPEAVALLYPVTTIDESDKQFYGRMPNPNEMLFNYDHWLRMLKILEKFGIDFKEIWAKESVAEVFTGFPFNEGDDIRYATVDFVLSHLSRTSVTASSKNILNMLVNADCNKKVFKEYLSKFINAGLDVNARDSNNQGVIHYAIIKDNSGAVEALIECGVDINSSGRDGITPLHFAAAGHPEITKYLLSMDADTTMVNKANQNSIEYSQIECISQQKCYNFSKPEYLEKFKKKYIDAQTLIDVANNDLVRRDKNTVKKVANMLVQITMTTNPYTFFHLLPRDLLKVTASLSAENLPRSEALNITNGIIR